MSTERDLLDAILAAPDDDGPRLIYADWLLECGDLRGELVAVECELARLQRGDPRRDALVARDHALQEALRGSLPPGTDYERGFPTTLRVEAATGALDAVLRRAPYRAIQIDLAQLPALVAAPELGSVRHLDVILGGNGSPESVAQSEHALRQLASWRHLARIAHLSTYGTLAIDAFRDLLANARLRELEVGNPCGPGDPVVDAIVRAPHATRLESLGLHRVRLGSPAPLATLRLRDLTLDNTDTTVEGFATLRPSIERLTTLSLFMNPMSEAIADVLASIPGHLDRFRLWNVEGRGRLGDRGLGVLASAPILRDARTLAISDDHVGPAGVSALIAAGPRPLETLDLSDSPIGDAGAALLARWSGGRTLRHLLLDRCGITETGARALATSPHLAHAEVSARSA